MGRHLSLFTSYEYEFVFDYLLDSIISSSCLCGSNSSQALQYLTLSYFKTSSLLLCVSTGTHSQTVVLVLILLGADLPHNLSMHRRYRQNSPVEDDEPICYECGYRNHQHVPSSTAVTTFRVLPAPNTNDVQGVVLSTSAWIIPRLYSFIVRERSCTEKLAHIPSLNLLLLMGISLFKRQS